MSGIIAVYGLVISVLIAGQVKPPPDQNTSLYEYVHHIPTQNWPDLVRSWILTEDIQRIHALGSRAVGWARRRSCRVYNRDCGRCGMPFFLPCPQCLFILYTLLCLVSNRFILFCRVCVPTCSNREFTSEWYSFWFSAKFSVFTGKFLPSKMGQGPFNNRETVWSSGWFWTRRAEIPEFWLCVWYNTLPGMSVGCWSIPSSLIVRVKGCISVELVITRLNVYYNPV